MVLENGSCLNGVLSPATDHSVGLVVKKGPCFPQLRTRSPQAVRAWTSRRTYGGKERGTDGRQESQVIGVPKACDLDLSMCVSGSQAEREALPSFSGLNHLPPPLRYMN